MSNRSVACSVVSCLKEGYLTDCLTSICRQSAPPLECFVFLNGAGPDECARWKERFPAFHFHYFKDDQLYCKPQNEGIRRSRAEFCLCLNDDIVLAPSYIEEALKAVAADEKIGMVSGCVMRWGKDLVDSAGLVWSRSRKPCDRGYGEALPARYPAGFVFGVNGAAAFYRRKMLDDIKAGGECFDESYGIYYEDLDISWRAKNRGWRAYYQPSALAYHKRGGSTQIAKHSVPSFLQSFAVSRLPHDLKVRLVKNRYKTIIKNDSLPSFLADLPWILFYEMRFLLYLLLFDRRVLRDILKDMRFIDSAWAKRRTA